ncbi:hypothetical protein [Salinicoccus carnicancri]|uniref:hypothetical protein n=1 Tax=Salinicoccus carnicancri TaxID=558170 RepID=UPI0003049F40|nr:hypothetical protein [Salinicoccus carnicancri]
MTLKHWLITFAIAMFFFAGVFDLITPEVVAWMLLISFLAIALTSIFSEVKITDWRIDKK